MLSVASGRSTASSTNLELQSFTVPADIKKHTRQLSRIPENIQELPLEVGMNREVTAPSHKTAHCNMFSGFGNRFVRAGPDSGELSKTWQEIKTYHRTQSICALRRSRRIRLVTFLTLREARARRRQEIASDRMSGLRERRPRIM
jgi:hypothetical protein